MTPHQKLLNHLNAARQILAELKLSPDVTTGSLLQYTPTEQIGLGIRLLQHEYDKGIRRSTAPKHQPKDPTR